MDIWSLHTKAHALRHMGSMKIKSLLMPKKDIHMYKISKWSEVYQHASRIISTFTGENFKNIINADMLIG